MFGFRDVLSILLPAGVQAFRKARHAVDETRKYLMKVNLICDKIR